MRACPRGVKVTSGLCFWPDSLGTAAVLPEAQWGQEHGQGSGQWLGTTFPRCWEPRLSRPDSQPTVFAKEAVPFVKCSLKQLYFFILFSLEK